MALADLVQAFFQRRKQEVMPSNEAPSTSPAAPTIDDSGNAVTQLFSQPKVERSPGLYGLLPEKMQHGALRNTLGALGDAFLVQGGHDPRYSQRTDRQKLSEAMQGYNFSDPDSVQQTIQQIIKTGTPGSIELATELQKLYEGTSLRKQVQEQNNAYHQDMTDNRQLTTLQRMGQGLSGMIANAKTPEQYASIYNRAEIMAQRVNPRLHASDLGLLDPQDWSPELTAGYGMTGNNVQQSADRGAGRETSERNTDVNANSRITAANISGGTRIGAANISASKPTTATMMQQLVQKQNSGQPLTPAEKAFFDKNTHVSDGKGRSLPAGLAVPGAGGIISVKTVADANKLPKGTKYRTPNGQVFTR